ncbi:hypothetical protein A3758_27225 [Oleiphilus sp. HI0118]|nr:hypothetical protein A3758_10650 [Oleiphilus sp. HI0118]KZZ53487.1 hypothetical protein A3758_27225 [Oleiphilus sp. HI0118]
MQFNWKKHGLIFSKPQMPDWACAGALTPTPFNLNAETIRVYCGFRDNEGVSRIGYVDLCSENPSIVKRVSKKPVLDTGRSGCFDDNGVILGDVLKAPNGEIRMYYVGFQLVKNVKFLAFSGLATSSDGENFTRVSEAPILDRAKNGVMINAIHSVRFENDKWRIWHAMGDGWQNIAGTDYPQYNIWHSYSNDGLTFESNPQLCVDNKDNEYRIGRPSVYKFDDQFFMLFTSGSKTGEDYFPGLATSPDGIEWTRNDNALNLTLGSEGSFDSKHLCYPRLFKSNNSLWAVYNGNNMGQDGFGLLEMVN